MNEIEVLELEEFRVLDAGQERDAWKQKDEEDCREVVYDIRDHGIPF